MYSLWQDLPRCAVFILPCDVDLEVWSTFEKLYNLGHNFLTRGDRAFILHMCIPCNKTFHVVPYFFYLVTLTFGLLLKNCITLAITFLPEVKGLSYCTCAFPVTRPFTWYPDFWPRDLDLEVWPTLKNFNLGHNFLTRSDRAFILHMCIPCDKTFHIVLYFLTLWPWPWSLIYFWKTL